MTENAIDITDVTKTYGSVTALDGVSLTVPTGTTVGLLGTNGAGKTTLFRLLVGHAAPDSGDLEVAGLSAADGVAIRRRVGYLPENAGFPPTFTAREVLAFHADVRAVPADQRADRIDDVLATVGLADAADRPVGGFSNGMNRRLGLATALVARPRVLLLDEPTSGLDPIGVDAFHGVIERLASETAITIVFSTHTLAEVERVCDRVVVLDGGSVRTAGRVDDLRHGVGDAVTVQVRLAGDDPATAVADRLRDVAAVRGVTVSDGGLTLRCGRADAYDVLTAVRREADVDGFEVREPGLEDVFRAAVGSPVGPSGGETA